jgi:hypothetical protein
MTRLFSPNRHLGWTAALAVTLMPSSLFACATCFGQSDAPLAKGMNMGILSLLAVVVVMWAGLIAFFVHLARRSGASAGVSPGLSNALSHETTKV